MYKIKPIHLVAFFYFLFFLKFLWLGDSSLINHYPFLTPDGFDWIVEGVYFKNCVLNFNGCDPLPVLRPPFFVLINSIGHTIGANKFVIGFVLAFAGFFTYYFLLKIAENFDCDLNSSWPLAIALTIFPLNYIKQYVLADSIAVCLSLMAIYILSENDFRGRLMLSSLVALIASLVQTYALIPFLIYITYYIFKNLYCLRFCQSIKALLTILLITILYFFILFFWRHFVPHLSTPDNFNLLKFSTSMYSFYLNSFVYFFAPFLAAYFVFGSFVLTTSRFVFTFLLTVLFVFVIISFFYQWPETRFIYFYYPWFLLFFFKSVKFQNQTKVAIFFVIASFWAPPSYWNFEVNQVQLKPEKNWALNFFFSKSTDRGLDQEDYKFSPFYSESDSYVKSTLDIYFKIE